MRSFFSSPRVAMLTLCVASLHDLGFPQGLHYSPPESTSLNFSVAKICKEVSSFVGTVGGDVLHVLSSPLRLQRTDGLKLLALTASTTIFITSIDGDLDHDFIEQDDFYMRPAVGLAKIGEAYDKASAKRSLIGLSLPILAGGVLLKDKKLLQTSRLLIESFLITGEITQLSKGLFGRARPYANAGPRNFSWFKFHDEQVRRSLPSGHTSTAFSMMTVIAKQYDTWWVKIPAYTMAVAVAMQRMESRNHWGADVILGGALGYGVASTLVKRYKKPTHNSSIYPYIGGNRFGILIRL